MRTKLVELRKALGYTQGSAAAVIGISRSHYSQIETGEKAPSFKIVMKIKQQFGYKGDDLFFNAESPFLERSVSKRAAKQDT